jgi:transposase
MPKPLVTDELWAFVEPLLPKEPPKPKGGTDHASTIVPR